MYYSRTTNCTILQIYIRVIAPGRPSRRNVYVYDIRLIAFHMIQNDGNKEIS